MLDAPTLRRMVARLAGELPVKGCRVRVRRSAQVMIHHERVAASASRTGRVWTITIDAGLSRGELVDALIHEWAHAHSGDLTHSARWGRSYAAAYRAFHGTA